MTLQEMETAVRCGMAVVALVLDNSRQGTIRMHQEARYPGRVIATELGATDMSMIARGMGMDGFLVEDGADLEPLLRAAVASGRPTLVQARMDRDQLSTGKRLRNGLAVSAEAS
jgi:acetolactate synthase-1/2/3 large subunit